jgi:hypothetical protein
LVVAFKDRFVAEKMMYGTSQIPSVGKVELSWVANPVTTTMSSTAGSKQDEDSAMDNVGGNGTVDSSVDTAGNTLDYDVAEDGDSWGIGV